MENNSVININKNNNTINTEMIDRKWFDVGNGKLW